MPHFQTDDSGAMICHLCRSTFGALHLGVLEALRSRNAPMTAYFLGARDVLCSSCLVEVSNMAGFEDALNFRQGHGRYDLLGFTLVIDGGA